MAKQAASRGGILIATESFSVRYDGADRHFVAGHTTVDEGHPVLKGIEHLFKPLTPNYALEPAAARDERWEQATAAPGEKRGG